MRTHTSEHKDTNYNQLTIEHFLNSKEKYDTKTEIVKKKLKRVHPEYPVQNKLTFAAGRRRQQGEGDSREKETAGRGACGSRSECVFDVCV